MGFFAVSFFVIGGGSFKKELLRKEVMKDG